MSFDPNSPANRAKFLKDNPNMTDKDYNRIFEIKKKQPSFAPTDANRKKFLKDNPNMKNKDFDKLFKAKGGVIKMNMGGVVPGRGGSFKGVK